MYDVLGNEEQYKLGQRYGAPCVNWVYDAIADALCREYGVLCLSETYKTHENKMTNLINLFMQEKSTDRLST